MLIFGAGGKLFLEAIKPAPAAQSSLSWGKRVQQQLIQGVLGGWRPVVADIAWLRVTTAWESRQWTQLYESLRIATQTQPESLLFWDMGAWHLAWNASLGEKNNRFESRAEIRKERELYWIEQGRLILEEGTVYHPDHYKLWLQLGMLHQQRRQDYEAAFRCFLKSSELPGAPSYVARMAGYLLEKQGDKERAREYWQSLLARSIRPSDRQLIEKRLLKLEKDSTINLVKPLP